MRRVRLIKPVPKEPHKLRVCAYARVSSAKDAMLHSLSAQVSYYSSYIQQNPDWEYKGVYADEAFTGTKDNRPEFQRLLNDCRAGKLDLIITKSISRLARNTVTMLETVRELKALNIDIYFEEQNIHSLSGDGELMLTILASYAQEESLSVSENCKWRIRTQFAKGRPVSISMLGYKLIHGKLTIIPKEAETVRMIFCDYLNGMSKVGIAQKLNELGIKTKRGGTWHESMVKYLLENEKYTGDMLLQKTFVLDHITKRKRYNLNTLPKYLVEGSHEPIIEKKLFNKVQEEIKRRAIVYHPNNQKRSIYPFTSKLVCDICKKHYRHKIANAGSKYASPVWICSTFNKLGKSHCASKQIPEDILMRVSSEVLGLDSFNETIFRAQIKEVLILANRLSFIFFDGRIVERTYKDNPRRKEV